MQEIIDNILAELVSAERYKVARPYADKICKMFAIILLAGESPTLAAKYAILSWCWRVKTVGVSQVEFDAVCAQLAEMSAVIRTDCAHKAEEAYNEADDGN